MAVTYTDASKVTSTRTDITAPPNRNASGYGGKIPTAHWVRYNERWHRVYIMCYSNSGTAYILVKGARLVLDTDTEYRIHNATVSDED
jgi:hypothetical protein